MSLKLEGRQVYFFALFIAAIVSGSMFLGHAMSRADKPTQVVVAPASPEIQVNVPQQAPPRIDVVANAAAPKVEVTVPAALPPTVNVMPPPPTTVIVREEKKEPVQEPVRSIPPTPQIPRAEASIRDEDLTLDSLYSYAERYIESYCKKYELDTKAEAEKWMSKYRKQLDQSIADGIDRDEQGFINRLVIQRRECFDIEKATPDKIVEGCRLLLRYRDGDLAWLRALRDAVTTDNLKKTLAFLSAGVR